MEAPDLRQRRRLADARHGARVSAPYGLTVAKLKAILAELPSSFDDRIVVLSKDSEGNGFDTLGAVAVGWYRNKYEGGFQGETPDSGETWEQADARVTKEYTTDEDAEDQTIELDEHDHPAVCLWP